MYLEPLDRIPLWVLFLVHCLLYGIAIEVGYRVGRWRHAHMADERDQPVAAMVASILGLLALVLGFTFNLAASRFDVRRQAVLDEANVIGTTYLRAKLLPEAQRVRAAELLREYVEVRLLAVQQRTLVSALQRSEQLHDLLWSEAVAAANAFPNPVTTGLFVQSLNDVIDLHAKRVFVGLRSRIPIVIWIGLTSLAVLGIASMGYQAGLSTTRRSPVMFGLILAFVFVMYLIADLDRGGEGMLQVNQDPLVDLQRSMRSE
jgi:hypothetical protein